MSIYKRGRIYWYKFQWHGDEIQQSTRQTNDKIARQMEAAHRTRLAKERDERLEAMKRQQCQVVERCPECERFFNAALPVNEAGKAFCSDRCASEARRKSILVPTLQQFAFERIEPWAKATFAETTRQSWYWYRQAVRVIAKYPELGALPLDRISNEPLAQWASRYINLGYSVSSANSVLRVIRRMLKLAVEWRTLETAPTVKLLTGESHREHVILQEEEQKFLTAADPELQAFSTLLFDTGMRPDEGYRLRWEDVNWSNGSSGSVFVTHGKTKAARRLLFMSPRLRFTLEHRWEMVRCPKEGWVWPAQTKCGHVDISTFKKRHARTVKSAGIRRFVPYSIRHTFLTRLGESGCDAWTLAKIAGHSSIAISQRYVHPSENAMANAMSKLSRYNSRYSDQASAMYGNENRAVTIDTV